VFPCPTHTDKKLDCKYKVADYYRHDTIKPFSLFFWWTCAKFYPKYFFKNNFFFLQILEILAKFWLNPKKRSSHLGPLYTRSQANVQLKSRILIDAKVEISPKALYTRSQGWNRENISNLPKDTNKCWTLWPCIGPQGWKKDSIQFRKPIRNPWGPMFQHFIINILTSML
jgi:hypothetical protein